MLGKLSNRPAETKVWPHFNSSASVGRLRPASPIRYTYLIARLTARIAPALLY